MKICNLQTMEVRDYREFFPNTSFPATVDNSFFTEQGYAIVNEFKKFDRENEILEYCPAYIENNEVFIVKVVSKEVQEIEVNALEGE